MRKPGENLHAELCIQMRELVQAGTREHVQVCPSFRDGIRRSLASVQKRKLAEEIAAANCCKMVKLAPFERKHDPNRSASDKENLISLVALPENKFIRSQRLLHEELFQRLECCFVESPEEIKVRWSQDHLFVRSAYPLDLQNPFFHPLQCPIECFRNHHAAPFAHNAELDQIMLKVPLVQKPRGHAAEQ